MDSDKFLMLPATSQILYVHLNMAADDDGFVGNPISILRKTNLNPGDLENLINKGFIIRCGDGIYVVTAWRVHNTLQSDRYTPSSFTDERAQLGVKKNKEYTLNPEDMIYILDDNTSKLINIKNNELEDKKTSRTENVSKMETQKRIDEKSIDKINLEEDFPLFFIKKTNEKLYQSDYVELIKNYPQKLVDKIIKKIITHPYYHQLNKETIASWCEDDLKAKNKKNYTGRDYDFDELEKILLTSNPPQNEK